jgi:hypothetical protein
MQNPLNPPGNPDPFGNDSPLTDPMLDALEKSIENPPGFTDPLVENPELLMDSLGRQLDAVEASMESVQPIPPAQPEPGGIVDEEGMDEQGDVPETSEGFMTPDSEESSETSWGFWGTFDSSPPLLLEGSASTPPPNPPESRMLRRGAGRAKRRKGPPPVRRRSLVKGGSVMGKLNMRYCPESHETIHKEECEDCEKYRRWPEGTDEELRQCWYDWQARPPLDKPDDEGDEGL